MSWLTSRGRKYLSKKEFYSRVKERLTEIEYFLEYKAMKESKIVKELRNQRKRLKAILAERKKSL